MEWLIDNYHLSRSRSGKSVWIYHLDITANSQVAGRTVGRVSAHFGLAWAYVAHTDSRFDAEILTRYVRAYQEIQPLTIGELWALAITLQIVMVENLRRLAERMVLSSAARKEADGLANRLLGPQRGAEIVSAVFAGHDSGLLPEAFAVQLIYRLRDQDPRVIPALTWLDAAFGGARKNSRRCRHDEHDRQATASVTVRNIITSMRLISNVDWRDCLSVSALWMRRSPQVTAFQIWISQPAISIAALLKNWRAVQAGPRSRSPKKLC